MAHANLLPDLGVSAETPAPLWQSLCANGHPDQRPHIVVLSALHGFVHGSWIVEPYEKLLTESRARELQCELEQFVRSVAWPTSSTRILIAGGGYYRHLMRAMVGALIHSGKLARHLLISEVSGGVGSQRSQSVSLFVTRPRCRAPMPVTT